MTDKTPPAPSGFKLADPAAFARNMATVASSMAEIAGLLSAQSGTSGDTESAGSLESAGETIGEMARAYMANPEKLIADQMELMTGFGQLWQSGINRMLGKQSSRVAEPARSDKRFSDDDWEKNPVFDFFKQSYLLTARWAERAVAGTQGLDEHTKHKAQFYVQQIFNALSPSNFAFTNPQIMRVTMQTNGQNLADGLAAFKRDLEAGKGRLKISQSDDRGFALGRNIAVTPGKVVYQNSIMQLIQYAPSTPKVHERPLVIIPPWINKFYILDLNEKKSFVRWAVAQGLTVFIVSWVNPDQHQAGKTFADYMTDGILQALTTALAETGADKANAIGYCVGGTLLSATLGVMAAKNDNRIASATFFTTQVDFTEAGDLLVFVDEKQLAGVDKKMSGKGYLEGRDMAGAFNLLRSNDLIWSYVVNNYLLGKKPMAFDLLYWNGDSTRMPAGVHSWYLRECYLNNHLATGKMMLNGVRADLSAVTIPVYNLAAREDHIAPLKSAFKLGANFGGDTTLVVAGSGHIAGVVNPPAAGKYQFWTNADGADNLTDWLAGASETPGSWWPHWAAWVTGHAGKKVKARQPGAVSGVIEDAPGSYVQVRSG